MMMLSVVLLQKEPANELNVPALPIDTVLEMTHPLICHPPSWLTTNNIYAPQMMYPEVIGKLVLSVLLNQDSCFLLQMRPPRSGSLASSLSLKLLNNQ